MKSEFKILEIHDDERGLLFEVLRDDEIKEEMKQVYFSISKHNAIRGNHYHKRKIEWFSVVKGKGKMIFEDNKSKKREEIILDGENPSIIKVNPHISHALQNITDEDMYLIVIANEVFNPNDADTFFKELI